MFLKRLELQGFKSFPEKIKLEFNKGITAVVGPNGSGKSNISDAVRWVLGEKSIKSLRGSKMEDVIFSGTQNRKPLGFAEVSMIIDNTDAKLNIDYSEVVITRRVYRSGESDFQINGSNCRLKDILELFMDTGVGREGYSIIGQGRIDEILSTKSEDRRLLFEEAVGIVKFKNRRIESESKLDKERQNLIRVNDIISELETQINPLEIQAEKTKKYLLLAEKLKLIYANLFICQVDINEKSISNIVESIKNIDIQISDSLKGQKEINLSKDNLKKEILKMEDLIENVTDELIEIRSLSEQKENDIKLIEQDIDYIQSDLERLNFEINNNNKLIKTKNNEINIISIKSNAKNLELKTKKDSFNRKLGDFEKLSSKMSKSEEFIDKYNNDILEKMQQSTEVKSKLQKSSYIYEQFEERKKQIDNECTYNESQLHDVNVHLTALKVELDKNLKNRNRIEINNNELIKKSNETKEKLENYKKIQATTYKSINEGNSKFKILSELQKEHEGYYGGVKAVLRQRDANNVSFSGICGAVGEIITVDEKFEIAIEVALGGAVQNIIAKTEEDVKKAIMFLKTNNKGRATFLPISAIKSRDIENDKKVILKENGVIGIAKDLIQYSYEYKNIVSSLLGRVIIVDNISSAIYVAKKYNYIYKIVTLEGELINSGGAMTGGSINKKSVGIFSRVRELNKIEKELIQLNNDIKNINETITSEEENLKELILEIEENKENIHLLDILKNDLENQIHQTENDIKIIDEKLNKLKEEHNNLSQKYDTAKSEINNLKELLNNLESDIETISKKLDEYRVKIQSVKYIKEESNIEITNLRIEINSIENELNNNQIDIKRLQEETDDIKSKNESYKHSITNKEKERKNKLKEIDFANNDIEKFKEKQNSLHNQINISNENKQKILLKVEKIEYESKEIFELVSNLKNELTRLEINKEQIENKNREIYDMMWEQYEMSYIDAQKFEHLNLNLSQLKQNEKDLKSNIKEIGSVNVNAIEEYKAVKERYEFLNNQKKDIIQAEENLNNIITELEKLMELQFKEQFKIISENFNIVFSEIFGGGSAYLTLAENESVLTSGIEIVAQPPGKNLQSMSLLSGGERALTAMALLFAILKMKPSPFCILDEIEAALDDANVNRYAEFIRKLSNDTQFIIITHRKGTMSVADILYGVTMQEQGVSKLVSVKLKEAEV